MTFRGVMYSVGDKVVRLNHSFNNRELPPYHVYEVAMLREMFNVQVVGRESFYSLKYFRPATAEDLRDLPHG